MSLRIECLGELAFQRDGVAAQLSSRKAQILLALLAASRQQARTRHQLAVLLWESSDLDQARTSLRQAIAQVRRALGEGWVIADGDTLRLGPNVSTDTADFAAALERSDTREAVRLYRGSFLNGITVADMDLDHAIGAERARLEELASGAFLRELGRLGNRPEAMQMAHRLLAIDPLNEMAHRCLMERDAARGARNAARARYETLRAALSRELGVEPEAETSALYDGLRRTQGKRADASTSTAESTASQQELAFLSVALAADTDDAPDWDAVALAAGSAGAAALPAGPGEAVFCWSGTNLRDVALALRGLAEAAGDTLSFGLTTASATENLDPKDLARGRRIAAVAEPGEIMVDARMATRLGLASGNGRAPVPLSVSGAPMRPELPICGRDSELSQIEAAISSARNSGSGLVIHICGEAGIGKSRLASEVGNRSAASGATVALVSFEAFARMEQHIAQRIVQALPQRLGPDPGLNAFDAAVWSWLTEKKFGPETELRMSALSDAERNRRLLRTTADCLIRARGKDELLLILEDCHWAPDGVEDFLLELSDLVAVPGITFLLIERPHNANIGQRLATRGRSNVLRITLSPLLPAAAARLAEHVAPSLNNPDLAIERAAGHPLFLIRLLESGWTAGELPETVAGLVQEQIERLSEAERSALRHASILGRSFQPADLKAIFPGTALPRPSGDLLLATSGGLAFGHDLIRQAIYEDIPETERRSWHRRAAEYYRAIGPLQWAKHASMADDDGEACRASAAAANMMIASRRFAAAQSHIEAGLGRGGDSEALAELHSCRAGIRRMRGDLHGALDDYRAAHAKALTGQTQVAMLTRQALVLHRLGQGPEADRALDAAEEIADGIGLAGLGRAEIHEQRGNRAFVRGDHAACLAHHSAGLAAAEASGDPRGIARAHGGLGDAHYAAGRFATAYRHFSETIKIAEAAGLGMVREEYLFMRAFSLFFAEPGPQAMLMADVAVESAIQCGAGRAEMLAREIRAEMCAAAGDLSGFEEDLTALETLASALAENRFSKEIQSLRVLFEFRRGNLDAARQGLIPILEGVEEDAYIGSTILGIAVLLAADRSKRDTFIAMGLDRIKKGSLSHAIIAFHMDVLERAITDQDFELIESHVSALRDYTAEEPLGIVEDFLLRIDEECKELDAAAGIIPQSRSEK